MQLQRHWLLEQEKGCEAHRMIGMHQTQENIYLYVLLPTDLRNVYTGFPH